jgi:STE24 endopeptidase
MGSRWFDRSSQTDARAKPARPEGGAAESAPLLWRVATITALAVVWLLGVALLWRTSVPGALELPRLDPRAYFSPAEMARSARYERFVRLDLVAGALAAIAALLVFVRRAPRLARGTGLGPIGAGMVVGAVMFVILWAVGLPFSLAGEWWDRRHGLAKGPWLESLLGPLGGLGGAVAIVMLQIAIVMSLARRYPRYWWLAVSPVVVVLAAVFVFVSPYLLARGVDPPKGRQLRSDIRMLARTEHVEGTPVDIEKISDRDTRPNAFATGLGPTTRVGIFDTLLDGRFSRGEVRFVVAHEFGHVAHKHLWKGLGWTIIFTLPVAFLLAQATRRRGGLGDPGVLPYGVLVLVLLNVVLTPLGNVVSRRYEAEADWSALRATDDPGSGRGLFEKFSETSLQEPNPPTWAYLWFETHPTIMQRIAMTNAWRRHR